MDGKDIWWTYWYFHLPNYALSAVFYCLFGRLALSFFLPADTKNYIFRSFVWITQWIVRPAAFITPSAMPSILMPAIAAFWVVVLRLALFTALYSAGLMPKAPAQAG